MNKELRMLPHANFSSSMRRCLGTFINSLDACLLENHGLTKEKHVEIKIFKNIRETPGRHTCDRRVSHSTTVSECQSYEISSGKMINWNYEPMYFEED